MLFHTVSLNQQEPLSNHLGLYEQRIQYSKIMAQSVFQLSVFFMHSGECWSIPCAITTFFILWIFLKSSLA